MKDHKGSKNPNYKGGHSLSKIWYRCQAIKSRCTNINHPRYNNYGGRGIALEEEWASDITSMIDYLLSIGYEDTLTIDRIDNNKGYVKGNIRFATYSEQNRNKRTTKVTSDDVRFIRYYDHGLTQDQLAQLLNCSKSCIKHIQRGRTWIDI